MTNNHISFFKSQDAVDRFRSKGFRKYDKARKELLDALERIHLALKKSVFNEAGIAKACGMYTSELYELTACRLIERNWAVRKLLNRCGRINSYLSQNGIYLPADIPNTNDVSEANAKRHHDEVFETFQNAAAAPALFSLLCLSEQARGAAVVSDQGAREVANSGWGFQKITEEFFDDLADLPAGLLELVDVELEELFHSGLTALARPNCAKHGICRHKIPGYIGFARGLIAIHRVDKPTIRTQWARIKLALSTEHDLPGEQPAFHWPNMLQFLRRLRAVDGELAQELALEALELARSLQGHQRDVMIRELQGTHSHLLELLWGPNAVKALLPSPEQRHSVARPVLVASIMLVAMLFGQLIETATGNQGLQSIAMRQSSISAKSPESGSGTSISAKSPESGSGTSISAKSPESGSGTSISAKSPESGSGTSISAKSPESGSGTSISAKSPESGSGTSIPAKSPESGSGTSISAKSPESKKPSSRLS